MNAADPKGLWSAEAHEFLMRSALSDLLSEKELKTVIASSVWLDYVTQGNGSSYKHSMRSMGEGQNAALVKRDKFIKGRLGTARWYSKSKKFRNYSLKMFGEAIHPLMDSTSPAHVTKTELPKGWNIFKFWKHGKREGESENLEDLTPEVIEKSNTLIRNAFKEVFGNAGTKGIMKTQPCIASHIRTGNGSICKSN
jgi:hypothetical protein